MENIEYNVVVLVFKVSFIFKNFNIFLINNLKNKFPKEIRTNEICENTELLYEFFRRTKVVNREKMEVAQIAEELNNCKKALCISLLLYFQYKT